MWASRASAASRSSWKWSRRTSKTPRSPWRVRRRRSRRTSGLFEFRDGQDLVVGDVQDLGGRVDELADQPGGGDPVGVGAGAGDPLRGRLLAWVSAAVAAGRLGTLRVVVAAAVVRPVGWLGPCGGSDGRSWRSRGSRTVRAAARR